MNIPAKPVYFDGVALGVRARTTLEAARAAVRAGARFDYCNVFQRTQHVGEGPIGFYVSAAPGAYPWGL